MIESRWNTKMQMSMKEWKRKIIEEGRFNKKVFPILSYPF